MVHLREDIWLQFCAGKTIFTKEIDHQELYSWEQECPHILIVYLLGNKACNYKVQNKTLQGLIDGQDLDVIILTLLSYPKVDLGSLETLCQIWDSNALNVITIDKFHFVLNAPYKSFMHLLAKKAFRSIDENETVYRVRGASITFKSFKHWEYLIELPWYQLPDKMFANDGKKIKQYLEDLKAINDLEAFQELLSEFGDVLGLVREIDKKRLMHRRPFVNTRAAELYFEYTRENWSREATAVDLERMGPYDRIKAVIRRYLKEGVIQARWSLDDVAIHACIIKEVYDRELRYRSDYAIKAINNLLRLNRETAYKFLAEMTQSPNARDYFLLVNKAFYDKSSDARGLLKRRIIDICNENNYLKLRKLAGGIGFFMGVWAIFLVHDVIWMFAAIAAAFILTWEFLAVAVLINKQEEGFVKPRDIEAEKIKNYTEDIAPPKSMKIQDNPVRQWPVFDAFL